MWGVSPLEPVARVGTRLGHIAFASFESQPTKILRRLYFEGSMGPPGITCDRWLEDEDLESAVYWIQAPHIQGLRLARLAIPTEVETEKLTAGFEDDEARAADTHARLKANSDARRPPIQAVAGNNPMNTVFF